MSIVVLGINHKTAPVHVREKMYFPLDRVSLYLQDLLNRGLATEAILISTCNRSELYCETQDLSAVKTWFCAQSSLPAADVDAVLYDYQASEAIAHLMEVACGLDSLVVGEPQILGQLKEAFSEGCAAGAVGSVFHRLFQQVFATAKEVRTTTMIGACPVSVASAAVRFVKERTDLPQAQVALIGAGDTTALLLRYLQDHLNKPVTLINRSLENAADMAKQFGGRVIGLERLVEGLAEADLVFSATGSAVPLVTKVDVQQAMQARLGRPLFMMDVAVPRDIDPDAARLDNVALYCIDDLKSMIEVNRRGREHAGDKARELIAARSHELLRTLGSHDNVTHTIKAYRTQIEDICSSELSKAREQLAAGNDPVLVLDAFARAFMKKLMHAPSVQLRQAGAEGRFELLKLAKQLFAIPDAEIERL